MRAHSAARLAAAGALLFACNGILGIDSDYHLAPGAAGTSGANGGGVSGSSTGGSAGTAQAGNAGATGATGGASGEGGEGGDAGASAGTAGTTGGTAGTSGGADCGNGMLDGAEECDDENSDSGDGCDACAEEPGYTCMNEPSVCMDVNECTLNTDTCHANATCTNTPPGSFTCTCNNGYAVNGGTCTPLSSCAGMTGTECQGGSCCESPSVTGGTFQQGEPDAFASTVSSFRLDRYEVTVARFRNFVTAYNAWRGAGNPASGAGANPNVSGSGWDTSWTSSLPANDTALKSSLQCEVTYQTWADSGRDTLPINCVNWYTAFAFCIWDGGRMPTEAEWEFAAARGASDSLYPWGNSPVLDDTPSNFAVYYCMEDGSAPGTCAFADIPAVGSKPAGEGFYQQRDLAGSMWEWTLDWSATYPASPSSNYAKVDTGSLRVIRGASWLNMAAALTAASRATADPSNRQHAIGFRCARAP